MRLSWTVKYCQCSHNYILYIKLNSGWQIFLKLLNLVHEIFYFFLQLSPFKLKKNKYMTRVMNFLQLSPFKLEKNPFLFFIDLE